MKLIEPAISINWRTGRLAGADVEREEKRLSDLTAIFHDQAALACMGLDRVIYRVEYFKPVPDGTEGGLFWGRTILEPGRVGDEYFMTKGHYHRVRNRAEYYAGIEGDGALILMDEQGKASVQKMRPGSLHYIPEHNAHRVANTGSSPLVFLACWPSDAGYDYQAIEQNGFGVRLLERNGQSQIVVGSSSC